MSDGNQVFSGSGVVEASVLAENLMEVGAGVRVFGAARIIGAKRVKLGEYVQIDDFVFINGGVGVSVGKYTHFAIGVSITGGGECEVGAYCGLAPGVRIITGLENIDIGLGTPTVSTEARFPKRGRVVLSDFSLLFTNTVVFPDVTIGEGAVAAAGSIIHRDLDPWSIYAGNPLVKIGVRDRKNVVDYVAKNRESKETSDS